MDHDWLKSDHTMEVEVQPHKDLLPNMRRNFDAKKTFRKAVWSVRAANAMQKDAQITAEERKIKMDADEAKQTAENEHIAQGGQVLA